MYTMNNFIKNTQKQLNVYVDEKYKKQIFETAVLLIEQMYECYYYHLRLATMSDGISIKYLEGSDSARFDIYAPDDNDSSISVVVVTRKANSVSEYKNLSVNAAVQDMVKFLSEIK